VREHSDDMHKPKVCLTFDLERDYLGAGSYATTPSFQGVLHNVPRILDKMRECHAHGTFFMTPEVMEYCGGILRDIRRRHVVGLHSHAYYQPEFKGWEGDGDSFRNYTEHEKTQMILRDIRFSHTYLGDLRFFRIARLEPDHEVLKVVSESGCQYDSSYHASKYHLFDRIWTALSYKFKEIPVDFHLYKLEIGQLRRKSRSVVLLHPITPPEKTNPEVYDEGRLLEIIQSCSGQLRFMSLDAI
jgi:peptidoglycan/xylan/chitin deacetylase (PgdA/CDA1 family)